MAEKVQDVRQRNVVDDVFVVRSCLRIFILTDIFLVFEEYL